MKLMQRSAKPTPAVRTCPVGGHDWQPTWSVGRFLCLRCGKTALCPICLPTEARAAAHVIYCLSHHTQEVQA